MTNQDFEQYWDELAANHDEWASDAFLGTFENEDGQTYCHVYDSEMLNSTQKAMIMRGINGDYQRDVWNQVMFLTESEYQSMKYPNGHPDSVNIDE